MTTDSPYPTQGRNPPPCAPVTRQRLALAPTKIQIGFRSRATPAHHSIGKIE
ncbi:hypothetical protein ABT097_01250 [Streptomyces sp. NPDC002225]|uniref:hypothetical protein n=1 Tax=Streptomyces sp. NPDC002225 TaxID=3154413 RepID=UPI0033247D8C